MFAYADEEMFNITISTASFAVMRVNVLNTDTLLQLNYIFKTIMNVIIVYDDKTTTTAFTEIKTVENIFTHIFFA